MATVYRIVNKRHADSAFDGEGAKLYGGRWNSKGNPAVYLSDSAALALLEVLVHINDEAALVHWCLFKLEVPERNILILRDQDLPDNWLENPPPISTQRIGDAWLASEESLALSVPSATLPIECRNIIVNPHHKSAGTVFKKADSEALEIDPRLFT